jgi:soluble lytic murein transglycosylase-like protein
MKLKFAAIALSIGCTAAFSGLAVQSELNRVENSALSVLERMHLVSPPSAPDPEAAAPVPVVLSIPKAEVLALIDGAAARYKVPVGFVRSIVTAESNFDCAAVSRTGALGLMQLMPDTAKQFGADPLIPAQNIDAGTHYLRWLMDRYRNRRNWLKHVIAAYNAGPGMVDKYRGVPPFRETRTYVARVMALFKQFTPSSSRKRATPKLYARNRTPGSARTATD